MRVVRENYDDAEFCDLVDAKILKDIATQIPWDDPILREESQDVQMMQVEEMRSRRLRVRYLVKDAKWGIIDLQCRSNPPDQWEGVHLFPSELATLLYHISEIALNDRLSDVPVLSHYGRRNSGNRKRKAFDAIFF